MRTTNATACEKGTDLTATTLIEVPQRTRSPVAPQVSCLRPQAVSYALIAGPQKERAQQRRSRL
jgi:hypothetical protein